MNSPKPKDVLFTITGEKERLTITSDELEPVGNSSIELINQFIILAQDETPQ